MCVRHQSFLGSINMHQGYLLALQRTKVNSPNTDGVTVHPITVHRSTVISVFERTNELIYRPFCHSFYYPPPATVLVMPTADSIRITICPIEYHTNYGELTRFAVDAAATTLLRVEPSLHREACGAQQEAAGNALAEEAAAERIALSEQEAADRKPIQLRDDALAEEKAKLFINAKNGDVNKALITACEVGYTSVAVRLVRHHGADVHYMNTDAVLKCTPHHSAAASGHTETVRALVRELGADVNAKDCDRNTPLHFAALNGHTDTVRALVEELGADVNAKNQYGETPLYHAADNGCTDVVRLLVKDFGADVNSKDSGNKTALHCASLHGHTETVRVLIEQGADVSAMDCYGNTPFDLVDEHGHREEMRALLLR